MYKKHDVLNLKLEHAKIIKQIEKPSYLKKKARYWLVLCKCGKECIIETSSLTIKNWQSCGCLQEHKLLNKKFGIGKVIKDCNESKNGKKLWLLRCKCSNQYKAFTESLISGNTKSCGCLNYRSGNESSKYKGYKDLSGNYWKSVRNGAINRGYKLDITIKFAWKLFIKQNKKCALTNWDISLNSNYKIKNTASLDRIDSSIGYEENNVQWVHKDLNRMKQNFKEDYLLKMCKAIVLNKGDCHQT